MSIKVRSSLHSLVIIAVLIFSAMGTTIAYADGGSPPTETTTECASDGTTNECSSGAVTVEEPAAPPAGESNSGGNQSGDNAAPAQQATLNDVPANTDVAVVNAEGQAVPLASQAAADALATSDPFWCSATQTAPAPGAVGCTTSFNSFNALLTFLSANPSYQGDGTIFVQQGNYQGGESSINFNNYTLSNISNNALTIQGGWSTSNLPGQYGTSTFNNTSIIIGNNAPGGNPWGGSLTINNLSLNFNPTGSSGTGITVYSAGNINLANVTVTNSATGAGAELNAGNDVNITNSRFDRNKTAGAIIRAGRDVAIGNSSFSNPANGRRQITGLDITADGAVSLADVVANTNRAAGATINAGGPVAIARSFFSDTKAMQGSNFIGYGLQIVTPDMIALDHVEANNNFLWGASLQAGGDVAIANSLFNGNTTASPGFIDDTGLLITSGGNVSISNSQANDNRLIGATINAALDIAISGSTFNNNKGVTLNSAGNQQFWGYGLQAVTTGGNINLDTVTASNNTLFGAHLETKGAGTFVLVRNSDFSTQTSGNTTTQTGRGLEVISAGDILLQNVTLNNNQTFGANLQAGGNISLDTITATGNGTNGVEAKGTLDAQNHCGTLILTNGTYTNNGQYGLTITDLLLDQRGTPILTPNGAGGIFQNPTTCVAATPVTPPTPPAAAAQTDTTVTDSLTVASLFSPSSYGFSSRRVGHTAIGSLIGNVNNSRNVTLNSFLANSTLARSTGVGLFVGKYAYFDTLSGMQIFAYFPVEHVAMLGPQQ